MNNFFKKTIIFLISIAVILAFSVKVLKNLFPYSYFSTVEKYCLMFDVDTSLAMALIKAESNFDKNAVSSANAKGLMQLTNDTFNYCNSHLNITEADIFNPEDNIRAGVWYVSYLIKRYNGNTQNALAAYNAGASNVDKWLKNKDYSSDGKTLDKIPFNETKNHSTKINNYKRIYEILY